MCIRHDIRRDLAFVILFDQRFRQLAYNWFLRWGANPDLAKELGQELIYNNWKMKLASYDPRKVLLRPYIRRAAYHLWATWVRQNHHRPEAILSDVVSPGNVEDEMAFRELHTRLTEGLEQLGREEHAVMEQILDGHSSSEIAASLEIEISAVYRRVYHARRRLETILGVQPPARRRHLPNSKPAEESALES